MTKRAKIIEGVNYDKLVAFVQKTSPTVKRDLAMIALSFKAGLRAKSIAMIEWDDVQDASGEIVQPGETFDIARLTLKGEREAIALTMSDALYAALTALKAENHPGERIIYGIRKPIMTANNVAQWFLSLYKAAGFQGCSSHSGRRTLITKLARNIGKGFSLVDVQKVAGHAHISTTVRYMEPSAAMNSFMKGI